MADSERMSLSDLFPLDFTRFQWDKRFNITFIKALCIWCILRNAHYLSIY